MAYMDTTEALTDFGWGKPEVKGPNGRWEDTTKIDILKI